MSFSPCYILSVRKIILVALLASLQFAFFFFFFVRRLSTAGTVAAVFLALRWCWQQESCCSPFLSRTNFYYQVEDKHKI